MLPELITAAVARPLLVANDLPVDDLDGVELLGVVQDGQLVAIVGLQRLDGCVLLRSLAVATTARERGLGGELCDAALERAGSVPVWLLTNTARDYFAARRCCSRRAARLCRGRTRPRSDDGTCNRTVLVTLPVYSNRDVPVRYMTFHAGSQNSREP